ncbi:MAG TPA: hypothetical protein VN851_06410 [Thermoanaerobaculia bacterium]|nr:hypothetical protein [Thermoanaerobaculia bacterium]
MDTPRQDSAHLRLPQDAVEAFAHAEAARDQGRLEDAARLFGRSATIWGAAGWVFHAADAYVELGAILLFQGRVGLLPELAFRVIALLENDPLPPGSRIKLAVYAHLMRNGAADQGAYFSFVHELRRHRKAREEHEEAPAHPAAHGEIPDNPLVSWITALNERLSNS